jgi:L-amino acid N-acyltransferase YncA
MMINARNALIRAIRSWSRPSKGANLRLLQQRGETLSSFTIRDATAADVAKLAELHVQTFNETYGARRSPTFYVREFQWRQHFESPQDNGFVLVVEDLEGKLVGFAKGHRYTHQDLAEYKGELNKIYLLRPYQRIGLGKQLMAQSAKRFLLAGIHNMVLFGTPQNPTCGFYEAMGGQRLYAKNGEFHGGYGFNDLQKLSALIR